MDLQFGLGRDALVEAAEQRAAAGQIDTGTVDVGSQLRRGGREGVEDGLLDAGNGFVEGVGNLLVVDGDFLGQSGEEVATQGGIVLRGFVEFAYGGADFDFHLLGSALTNDHVVLFAHILNDVLVELVAGNTDGVVADDAAEGDDGDFCGAASDVDNHVAFGFEDVDADTYGCSHGFMDHADFLGSGLFGAFTHGAFLDIGDAGGDADDHAQRRRHERAVDVGHADKLADEVLSHLEVGDDAAAQRTDGLDVFVVGLAGHHLGAFTDGDDAVVVAVDGHDGGFVDDYLVVVDDNGVGGAKVHCYLFVKE